MPTRCLATPGKPAFVTFARPETTPASSAPLPAAPGPRRRDAFRRDLPAGSGDLLRRGHHGAGLAEHQRCRPGGQLSLIHISEPTRLGMISYAVFCLKKK